jgi:cytokinin dehydrogenase
MFALWVPARSMVELLSSVLRSPEDLAGLTDLDCTALDTRRFRRPLFQIPSDDCIFSMWLKRSTIKDVGPGLQAQLDANERILERALRLGGKRYAPYGGIVSSAAWAVHYGKGTYGRFQAAKKRFDPHGVLTPGTGVFG